MLTKIIKYKIKKYLKRYLKRYIEFLLLFKNIGNVGAGKIVVFDTCMSDENKRKFIDFAHTLPDPFTYTSIVSKDSLTISDTYRHNLRCITNRMEDFLRSEVTTALRTMGATDEIDAIIIKGLPMDDEIPSFQSQTLKDRSDKKTTKISENVILGLNVDCKKLF